MGTEATLTDVLPASGLVADDAVAGRAAGGVLLGLGSSRYAVAMADVAEVAAVPGVTRVPGSPPWLSGVANWRGRMLPVLDLRPLLATPTVPLASSARLVVLGRDDVVVGLVVEAVPGVHDGDLGDLAPAAAHARSGRRSARARPAGGPPRPGRRAGRRRRAGPPGPGRPAATRRRTDLRAPEAAAGVPRPAYTTGSKPRCSGDGSVPLTCAWRHRVDFWKRINGASSVTLAVTLVAAAVAVLLDRAAGAPYPLAPVGLWLPVGVSAGRLALMTTLRPRLVDDHRLTSATAPACSSPTSSGSPAWSPPPAASSGPTGPSCARRC